MTRARDIANLVDANGDIVAGALDNVPAADVVNDTTPQLGGNLDAQSNDITSVGNVGIGTASPSEELTVSKSDDARISITSSGTGKAAMTGLLEFDGSDGRHGYIGPVGGVMRLNTDGGYDIMFQPGGTEKVRFTSGGSVGIGTSAPISQSKLTVAGGAGSISVTGSDGNFSAGGQRSFIDFAGGKARVGGTGGGSTGTTLGLYVGTGKEAVSVTAAGEVTMPYQPSFWAFLNGNWTSWIPNNQTQVVPFDQAYYNIGNNYNTSTGLYTCPVAGVYVFTCGVYVGVSSVEQTWLVKNGVRQPTLGFANAGTSGDRSVGTFIVRCAANDTIGICPYANTPTTSTVFANFHHSFFMGTLIG